MTPLTWVLRRDEHSGEVTWLPRDGLEPSSFLFFQIPLPSFAVLSYCLWFLPGALARPQGNAVICEVAAKLDMLVASSLGTEEERGLSSSWS